jgi:poly-gamma-glutamate synthesis protein (capsule biosynthesis protein)
MMPQFVNRRAYRHKVLQMLIGNRRYCFKLMLGLFMILLALMITSCSFSEEAGSLEEAGFQEMEGVHNQSGEAEANDQQNNTQYESENGIEADRLIDERDSRDARAHLEDESEVMEPEPITTSMLVMAVGDIMMHMPQVNAGRTENGHDFLPFFKDVIPIFETADVVIGNLETTLGGAERGFSGYPRFNSPDQLADALKAAGFDVLSTANNHSLDTNESGLLRTLDQLDIVGLKATGTYRSEEERHTPLMIEANEIKLAVLAYTYGTNGIPIPRGKDYLVNLLDEALMRQDIEKARELGADFVAVNMHFGNEYQPFPSREQERWVDILFELGADMIFGSHPHVLQPLEIREWTTETGEVRRGVVIYSLGNFISNQRTEPRDIGGIISVELYKTGDETTLGEVSFIPTWVHRFHYQGKNHYRILPMKELLVIRDYPELRESDYVRLEERYLETVRHVTGDVYAY